jgi:hypothetical protein
MNALFEGVAGPDAMCGDGGGADPSDLISRDYAAALRMNFLSTQNAALVRQTQFADTKAGAVLAFAGLVAARAGMQEATGLAQLGVAALLALGAVVLALCLVVLTPRYPGVAARRAIHARERFSWVALCAPDSVPDDFVAYARGARMVELLESLARANHAMAQILLRKFRYLRIAFRLAVLQLALAVLLYADLPTVLTALARL